MLSYIKTSCLKNGWENDFTNFLIRCLHAPENGCYMFFKQHEEFELYNIQTSQLVAFQKKRFSEYHSHIYSEHPWLLNLYRVYMKSRQRVAQIFSKRFRSLTSWPQLSLNSGSAQTETLLAACRRFVMVRISNNGPGWK